MKPKKGSEEEVLQVLAQFDTLRQYRIGDKRAPHKPLLILYALGQFEQTGSSALDWADAALPLGRLMKKFSVSHNTPPQVAAYPFTRLRNDGLWLLSTDVEMDRVGQLNTVNPTGRFPDDIEAALHRNPDLLPRLAGKLASREFEGPLYDDALLEVGLDPEYIAAPPPPPDKKTRSNKWKQDILLAWDQACAFCSYDGRLVDAPIGIDAAHIHWFNHGGDDAPDNGMALCSLHHRLFDYGAIGLTPDLTVTVSEEFQSVTATGRAVRALHGTTLTIQPGVTPPAEKNIHWHRTQVFHGRPIQA